MSEIPAELQHRCNAYCQQYEREIEGLRGWGLHGYVWQTTQDGILKVFFQQSSFRQELAVYLRLQARQVDRLQGFQIPILLNYDKDLFILELSYVRPPFVLDFADATLDTPPLELDVDSAEWISEKRSVYGQRWPDVSRLLDALRHLGIFYTDVHSENIRVDP